MWCNRDGEGQGVGQWQATGGKEARSGVMEPGGQRGREWGNGN